MKESQRTGTFRSPSFPIIFLTVLLSFNVCHFSVMLHLMGLIRLFWYYPPVWQTILAFRLGYRWKNHRERDCKKASVSAMAFYAHSSYDRAPLSGTWLLSGIVPAMIYYGLQILNPSIFLFAACVVLFLLFSIATGSFLDHSRNRRDCTSLVLAKALGISEGLVVGVYPFRGLIFGDKNVPHCPIRTNLAPAMAGNRFIYTHQIYGPLPPYLLYQLHYLFFLILGFSLPSGTEIS